MSKLEELVARATPILAAYKAGTATPEQLDQLPGLVRDIDAEQKSADAARGEDMIRRLGTVDGAKSANTSGHVPGARQGAKSGERQVVGLKSLRDAAAGLAGQVGQATGTDQMGRKSVTVGSFTQSVNPVFHTVIPVRQTNLVDVLPAILTTDRHFSYLQMTGRTIRAGVVPAGALKPSSDVAFEQVRGELAVVAHLIPGVDEYMVDDVPFLETLLNTEAAGGVGREIERQFLFGDGTAGQMPGVLNASGIQTIAAGPASPIQKVRDAITGLEVNDLTADVIVMGPADWAAVETAADGNGRYLLEASPVDRADRRLWGVPVVVSTVMPANTAAVLNAHSVALATDGKLKINLAQPGEDFSRNLFTIRAEMRAWPALIRANGVVRVNLAAA